MTDPTRTGMPTEVYAEALRTLKRARKLRRASQRVLRSLATVASAVPLQPFIPRATMSSALGGFDSSEIRRRNRGRDCSQLSSTGSNDRRREVGLTSRTSLLREEEARRTRRSNRSRGRTARPK